MSPTLEPATAPAAEPQRPGPAGGPPPPRPAGVLVVDDEDPVRDMLRSGLELYGFRVLTAADGAEAVSLYPDHAAEIAVVLLDVRMPGLDGPQALDALRRVNPDVVACFMSGDTGNYELDDLLSRGARHVFAKPFNLGEVARALRALVPADPPAGP